MKTKPFTKEHLIAQLAEIRQSHAEWVSGDELRRKEFAKAFGWRKSSPYSHTESEPKLPSWSEIFTEIGKLLGKVLDESRLVSIEDRLNHFDFLHSELTNKSK